MHRVVHLSSVHTRYDTRILLKECFSLVKAGFHVSLIVADGKGDEVNNGVCIFDVGDKATVRLKRMTLSVLAVCKKALSLNADIYHFHDPELIPVGLLLRMQGKIVIYDVHEDLPRQIMGKQYLALHQRKLVSMIMELFENVFSRCFSAICTATPYIRNRFKQFNRNTIDINNYPILKELDSPEVEWNVRSNNICYVGMIAENRGIVELIDAMVDLDCQLDLAGVYSPASLRNKLIDMAGWEKVNELGFVDRDRVKSILTTCCAGIVTFWPLPNHVNAQPNKMFEYMSAGIPVIASGFLYWKEIIEEHNCGICVNPKSSLEILKAVNALLGDDKLAATMGANGRKAVETIYNWDFEERKLISLYRELMNK